MKRIHTKIAHLALLSVASLVAATACSTNSTSTPSASPSPPKTPHAVVLVSGLDTQTPFTTPTQACTQGLPAGNSLTALRQSLISAGNQVFTAPSQNGPGQVTSTVGFAPSSTCPPPLPTNMTINTTAGIDAGGASLTTFLSYLKTTYGVDTVDFVGHSMGGLFSTSAVKQVKAQSLPIKIRSLTTLSTPWTGAYPADYTVGKLPLSACLGESFCKTVLTGYKSLSEAEGPAGAATQITTDKLMGPKGWNSQLGDALNGIPVTLIGGDYFRKADGRPAVWPNDAIVAAQSSLATAISDKEIAHRSCMTRPDVHTITLADQLKLGWNSAITWDPDVLAAVNAAVKDAESALGALNRQGCP